MKNEIVKIVAKSHYLKDGEYDSINEVIAALEGAIEERNKVIMKLENDKDELERKYADEIEELEGKISKLRQ